jgi:acyl-CoA hydrolase/RimJ/RimL family protein N-acetyltransferase
VKKPNDTLPDPLSDRLPDRLFDRLPGIAYAAKERSAAAAVREAVRAGDHVFVGSACATPRTLVAALEAWEFGPADVELLHFLTDHAVPHGADGRSTTRLRHRSFFVGSDLRAAVEEGLADYVPMALSRVPALIALGRIAVDVAFVQVSPPDAFGYVNLGVSVDIALAAVAQARVVVAEVNPAMPRCMGAGHLHIDRIDFWTPVEAVVIEYRHPPVTEAAVQQIARYIGSIIDDGSTLQIGLGRIVNEALKHLTDRQDLGIHSDVITDALLPLLDAGIVNGAQKSRHHGRVVTSFAMGTQALYQRLDANPLFQFLPIDQVADAAAIAAQHKMVSVTQAFAVDLTGQVCAEALDGRFYSGLAAQAEFLRGAAASPGGKAIVCLASTQADANAPEGLRSCIQASLGPRQGVTVARSDVHYLITEYGIAYLFGKSIRERVLAVVALAHPRFRAELMQQAQVLGYVGTQESSRNLQAYPVQDERHVALADGRVLLLRPSVAADGPAVRVLFHGLSERDVYTRFFRKLRGLPDRDVARLCNLNFETEVAFVACSGERESEQVVAHACYFIDPGTNLAETAFMVHPAWRGSGLGKAMQQRLAEHAQARGVRGFVAEILATNDAMIRLARAGTLSGASSVAASAAGAAARMHVESEGSTVRITTLF